MFTVEQINEIHARLGKAQSLPQYLQALNAIGVERCDSFVVDGHSEFFDKSGHRVVTEPAHENLTISQTSSRESFLEHLSLHNNGQTTYLEMSEGLAASGIEKWVFDTNKMTITSYDRAGEEMLVEPIG